MKKQSITKKSVMAVALIACISFAYSAFAQQPDKTQEKIRLMVTAVQARDSGDLQASKQAIEELLKIAPNDKGVQQLLLDVNADIERQAKGQAPVLMSEAAATQVVAKTQAEKAAEEKAAAEAAAKKAADEKLAAEQKAADEKLAAEQKAVEEKTAAEKLAADEAAAKAAEAAKLDAAMSDAVRKQKAQIFAAYDLIQSSYDAMSKSNWAEATDLLARAEAKLPDSDLANDAKGEIKAARAAMAKERAQLAIADKNPAEAKVFAGEYAANAADAADGQKFVSQVDNAAENPYNNSLKDINPGYVARQAKVQSLLKEGRTQYLYGDYQGARITFREIETLDADNVQAKAYQKLIAEKLADSGRLTYDSTRASMLDEVNRAWQRPQVYIGSRGQGRDGNAESPVEQKLNDIVIGEVSFPDPGVPLAHAISTLSILSTEFDKSADQNGKKGVNIVLFDPTNEAKNVVLTLRDLNLGQILDLVTRQVGFQYDIEQGIIVVRKGERTTAMETQDFPITSATVTRMIGFSATPGSSDSSDPFGGGGAAGAAGGSTTETKEEPIKNFLVKAGVDFGQGATLAFDGTKLWVTNTRRNLEKVRNILLRYNEVKQVEIEAKFMEVNQGALQELGFNYTVSKGGQVLFNSTNRSLSQTSTGGSQKSDLNITTTNPDTNTTTETNLYQYYPQLPATINLASQADPMTSAVVGVLDGYDFKMVVNALEQRQGSDLLSSPKVTVLSGSTASIIVSQQMRFPESWGDVQSNVGSTSSDTAGSAGVTITPGTPQDFTTFDVGVVMEVTPNVEEDGSINLSLNPKVTEFEGFMEYGGYAVAISNNTTVTVPSGFIQPVFSVREIRTTVTVFDGATVVMGGLTREEVRTVDDQIPVLGDIPLIGRLFQSKGESRQKKNLLIFVTANRITPGGSVTRSEQFAGAREGSGSIFQNPIIVAPSGAVHRIADDDAIKSE